MQAARNDTINNTAQRPQFVGVNNDAVSREAKREKQKSRRASEARERRSIGRLTWREAKKRR